MEYMFIYITKTQIYFVSRSPACTSIPSITAVLHLQWGDRLPVVEELLWMDKKTRYVVIFFQFINKQNNIKKKRRMKFDPYMFTKSFSCCCYQIICILKESFELFYAIVYWCLPTCANKSVYWVLYWFWGNVQ